MSRPRTVELAVHAAEEGTRLDVALAARPEIGSRAAAQRLIEQGHVRVDGKPRAKRHRLAAGERVVAELPERAAPDTAGAGDVRFSVAFEDEHLLVVDKPAGVVVHPSPGHPTGTLAQALAGRAHGGREPLRPGIVHRLDRDTSGLLVVAKSDPVHRALQQLIRERKLRREYLALIEGRPAARTGTIDAAIGRDRRRRTLVSTSTDRPREARTHFETLELLTECTLLAVRLETGRTHQIRAHLAAIAHPVCGDVDYGGGPCGARIGLRRQFLHSARLELEHPVTHEPVSCSSPLPPDLESALAAARRPA